MDNSGRAAAVGRCLILAAAVLWSLGGVVTKRLDLDPGSIAFYRSLFAGLASLVFVRPSRWRFRPAMAPLCLAFGAMIGLYIGAVVATTAANAIFLQCTSTFWVVPLGLIFLNERPDRRSIVAILVALIGVVAIVGYGHHGGATETRGIALGLGSGVAFSIVLVSMRGLRDLDPLWISAVENLGGAVVLGAWIIATGHAVAMPTSGQSLALVAFGIIQMAIPYALFARGLRHVRVAEAGLIGLLEPVLSPVWVVIFHGERPHDSTLLGGVFLLLGVAVRYWPTSTRQAA